IGRGAGGGKEGNVGGGGRFKKKKTAAGAGGRSDKQQQRQRVCSGREPDPEGRHAARHQAPDPTASRTLPTRQVRAPWEARGSAVYSWIRSARSTHTQRPRLSCRVVSPASRAQHA